MKEDENKDVFDFKDLKNRTHIQSEIGKLEKFLDYIKENKWGPKIPFTGFVKYFFLFALFLVVIIIVLAIVYFSI